MYASDGGGTTVVSVARLNGFGGEVSNASQKISAQTDQLTQELLRTLAEWGEGTESRNAYNDFKKRVDNCLASMHEALSQMPGAIAEAAASAAHAEKQNTALFI